MRKKSRRYEDYKRLRVYEPRQFQESTEKLVEAARAGAKASKRQGHHIRPNTAPFLHLT